ncbi:5-demethoxyubiquinone hydroxylase-like protein [Elsinoe fawcettii]|nr:5-demethoxyubiquinone hydroxylase-like protein [Elsinoe fawcettii]
MLATRTIRPLSRRGAQLAAPRLSASITSSSASPETEPKPRSVEGKTTQKRTRPLTDEQRKFLDSALRVNHAGELAAVRIYAAQTPPVVKAHPHLRPLMQHMYDQEAGHFKKFNEMLAKHRIRPTIMYPIWQVAATTLGWTTAIMGREAAMACTEAVETEIGEHYNGQVREILGWIKDMEERGEEPGEELTELIKDIRRIRDEELEHLDHAVEHDAKEAQPYELLTNVIRGGCRAAIWITEKV